MREEILVKNCRMEMCPSQRNPSECIIRKFCATYGVYYVFGNHDKGYYPPEYRGYDGDDLISELEKNNVHVMQDYEKRENTNFIVTSGISDWAIKFNGQI